LARPRVGQRGRGEELQRHLPAQTGVLGAEDGAHPSLAELLDQTVLGERAPREIHENTLAAMVEAGQEPWLGIASLAGREEPVASRRGCTSAWRSKRGGGLHTARLATAATAAYLTRSARALILWSPAVTVTKGRVV